MKAEKSIVFSTKEWGKIRKIFKFSNREEDVLRMVFQGYNNEQVARGLNISYNTVKAHLANIYRRMGVGSKSEAIIHILTTIGFKLNK